MTDCPHYALLPSRALIRLEGPEWRTFLQGLITQDVLGLGAGELRFGALLTPQGRLLFDLFLFGDQTGCFVECQAVRRDDLLARLTLYRLRAKVTMAASDAPVAVLWNATEPPAGWARDPRHAEAGWRGVDLTSPTEATIGGEADYDAHLFAVGLPAARDWGVDATYPIEADFDLLNGIDFKKGCFVGQETTSRMKRRGTVKTRFAPVETDGPVAAGEELLAGDLRAGVVLTPHAGGAMASLRLDRLDAAPLRTANGVDWRPRLPAWLQPV